MKSKNKTTVANTLRDIANESALSAAEKYSLRSIATEVQTILRASKKVIEVFDEWDCEEEFNGTDAARARNKKVRAYAALIRAMYS